MKWYWWLLGGAATAVGVGAVAAWAKKPPLKGNWIISGTVVEGFTTDALFIGVDAVYKPGPIDLVPGSTYISIYQIPAGFPREYNVTWYLSLAWDPGLGILILDWAPSDVPSTWPPPGLAAGSSNPGHNPGPAWPNHALLDRKKAEWTAKGYPPGAQDMAVRWAQGWISGITSALGIPERASQLYPQALERADRWLQGLFAAFGG